MARSPLRRSGIDCPVRKQPATRRAAALGTAGLIAVLVSLVSGCGVSSVSGVALDPTASCASVYPSPGTHTASTTTQVSIRSVASSSMMSAQVGIVGSKSGHHSGRWIADSDGDGASFYPNAPFAAGEAVTVTVGVPICGATHAQTTFSIAVPPGPLAPATTPTTPPPETAPDQPTLTYASMPTVKIPKLAVKVPANFGGQYIFETPRGGTTPQGPMIVDGKGQVVWFGPLSGSSAATDFRAQTYDGQPVLTWWEGGINPQTGAPSGGRWVIMNSHYQIIKTVRPGSGYASDEHEFLLSPSGTTAWLTAIHLVGSNLTAMGGPTNGAVIDNVAQEIDLATGNVLFEWHSLDHVPVTDSYMGYTPSADFDYFHINSIDPQSSGTVVISARNTHAVYAVAQTTGALQWELGGKHSTFTMGPGANFALQHDARMHGANAISIFDDEDAPPRNAPARAIVLSLNFQTKTATLVRALTHDGLKVQAQGNQQILANGDTVVGWGSGSATTVYGPSGTVLFDASFGTTINSYRAYLLPWSGTPTAPPSIAAGTSAGRVTVYASWNGSTATARWAVRGGSSPAHLTTLATAPRTGFQTDITLSGSPRVVEVIAKDAQGQTLGVSPAITPTSTPVRAVVTTP